MRYLSYGTVLAVMLLLSACDSTKSQAYQPEFSETPVTAGREYIFGIHPQRNPKKLRQVFGPLIDYLNKNVKGATFVFEASRNFAAFDQKLEERQFDFVLPNPYGTVKGIDKGYRVFGMMGNENDCRGIVLVRRDSPITQVADLKGKTIGFPAPTAFAATMLTKYFFHIHGLDVAKDIKPLYVGSMESSFKNVQMRNVAAGTAYPPAWRMFQKDQPEVAADLKVLWETEHTPDNALMARDDIPQELVDRVASVLFNMPSTPEGRVVLASMDLSIFKPATNASYDPVRVFLKKYQAALGPQEQQVKK